MNKKITKRSRRVVKNKKYKSVKKGGSGGVGEYPCGLCGTRHRDPFEAIDCYTKCEEKEKAASGASEPPTGPALVSAATSVERPLTVDGILTRSRAPYANRNTDVRKKYSRARSRLAQRLSRLNKTTPNNKSMVNILAPIDEDHREPWRVD